jgi:hypothetical protein
LVNRLGAFLVGCLVGGGVIAAGGYLFLRDDSAEPAAAPPAAESPTPSSPPSPTESTPAPSPSPSGELAAPLDDSDRLRLDGIGALTVGMTVEEMEEATGMELRIFSDFTPSCRYSQFDDVDDLHLMLSHRILVRIDVEGSMIETVSGIGIGDPRAEAERVYAEHLTEESHPYLMNRGSYLVYDSDPNDGLLMILEADRREILSFRSGYEDQVRYVEGCA